MFSKRRERRKIAYEAAILRVIQLDAMRRRKPIPRSLAEVRVYDLGHGGGVEYFYVDKTCPEWGRQDAI